MADYLRRRLAGRRLIVVSNREPYVHERMTHGFRCTGPDGGLVSALHSILAATGGTWIAHGNGSADRQTTDEFGRLRVPPGLNEYTLRRVFLNRKEEDGFYYKCCHEAIWPLCHATHHRPEFNEEAWEEYGSVNERFARAVVQEAGSDPCLVLIQNYHFALLPRLLKTLLPKAILCHFWHIPWPSTSLLNAFPWKKELLDGLLGCDVLFFHLAEHVSSFLEAVRRETACEVDPTRSEAGRDARATRVRSDPISVDFEAFSREALSPKTEEKCAEWRERLDLGSRRVLLSMGRFDYTEGFPERILAFRRLLEIHSEYRGRIVLLEIAIPARGALPTYTRFRSDAIAMVEELNRSFGTPEWRPVIVVSEEPNRSELSALYRLADVCLVTSLHDGMSLVAKEYISARPDARGSLVLSTRSGASRELKDAILADPLDVADMAGALRHALEMPDADRERAFHRLRSVVRVPQRLPVGRQALQRGAALVTSG